MTTDVSTLDHRINRLGAAAFFAPPVLEHGRSFGIEDPIALYAGGRGGVLGDVPWHQIQSSFAFFPPEFVQDGWNRATSWGDPREMAEHYAAGMAIFGRATYPDEPAAAFNDLAERVVDSVIPLGYPLFAGWRAMARPDDPAGRAAILLQTMRELRGDIHVQDIAAAGLLPIEAEIVVRGVDGMALHGWQGDFPDPDDHRPAVAAATARTTERMTAIYDGVLDADEFRALCDAVAELAGAAGVS